MDRFGTGDLDMEELIIRCLQGRAAPEEERRLAAWRESSEADSRFEELERLWGVVGIASALADAPPRSAPSVDEILARADGQAEPRRRRVFPVDGAWVRTAAVGALAAGVMGLAVGLAYMSQARLGDALTTSEIVTGPGEMSTLTLSDGSSVRLGPDSRLQVWESADGRHAYLEGRAFFGVSSDPSRPFIVRTSKGEARVVGTRFEVRSDEASDEFSVMVVEGEVEVAVRGSEASVKEGEVSRSVGGTALASETVDDVFGELGWLGDAMVWQGTPLERALSEIRSRYGLTVELVNPDLAEMTVTATFTAQPAEQVVFVLCEIVGAPCSFEGDRILVGRISHGI